VESKLDRVSKTVGDVVRVLAIGSGIVLLCLMVLTVVAVTLRKFNNPIFGAQDLSESGLVIVVFFAMAYSGWTGGHIAVDLIGGFVKPRALELMDTVTRAVSGGFFMIVTWQSMRQGLDALEYGDGFNLLPIPHYPFFFIIAFGSAVFAFILFVLAVRAARGFPELSKQ
jgi:TRAP-type transport system small permease protein